MFHAYWAQKSKSTYIASEVSRPSKTKRLRRTLVDTAVEHPSVNVEEDSAGLRREFPLVDAAKSPDKDKDKVNKPEDQPSGDMQYMSDDELLTDVESSSEEVRDRNSEWSLLALD